MREEVRSAAAALQPVLNSFHAAQGKQLTAVLWDEPEAGERLLLIFGSEALYLLCDGDADVIDLAFGPADVSEDAEDVTADPAWSRLIGREFFWGWLTVNQQGVADGVLMSFDGVVPEIGVNVVASSFEVLEIKQPRR